MFCILSFIYIAQCGSLGQFLSTAKGSFSDNDDLMSLGVTHPQCAQSHLQIEFYTMVMLVLVHFSVVSAF